MENLPTESINEGDDIMGFKFNKSIGPKGFKINIGKKGISSASAKIAPGVTLNSKRGATVGIPGTGISYNTGGRKSQNASTPPHESQATYQQSQARLNARLEYNRGWKEFTGGYNRKAMIAVGVCLVLCVTPLWPLGLVLSIPSLLWFVIDTLGKVFRYKRYLGSNPIK